MANKITVALAGLGSRGKDTYAKAAKIHPDKIEIVAIADVNPKKVEMALWKLIPPEEGSDYCHRLVNHGRKVCTARTKPYCDRCCLKDICAKNGVEE